MTVDRETVQFDQGGDCWVDVAEFTDLTHGADLTGLGDPSGLEKAIALYRGPFLEGFSLRDSPAFEQWALVMRERLQRQVMEALGRLSAQYEGQGEWGRATELARRQLELEPWDEGAHQALMRLLARSGRRAEALAQYEACVQALKDELDVEPAEETRRLYERIRDEEIGAATVETRETRPAAETGPVEMPLRNLPAALTPFVGREVALAEIAARLQDPACRLVTLVGLGGSGKTRLALEAARRIDGLAHGVAWVSLAPVQATEAVIPTIAQALGLSLQREGIHSSR